MKVYPREKGILIVAETDFEESHIRELFGVEKKIKAFCKHGASVADFVGLVVEKDD